MNLVDTDLIERVTNRLLGPWPVFEADLEDFPDDIPAFSAEPLDLASVLTVRGYAQNKDDGIWYKHFTFGIAVAVVPNVIGGGTKACLLSNYREIGRDSWLNVRDMPMLLLALDAKESEAARIARMTSMVRESEDFPDDALPELSAEPLSQVTVLTALGYAKSPYTRVWFKDLEHNLSVHVEPSDRDFRCKVSLLKNGFKPIGALCYLSDGCGADSLVRAIREKEAEAKQIISDLENSPVQEAEELAEFPDNDSLELPEPIEKWEYDLTRILHADSAAFADCDVTRYDDANGCAISTSSLGKIQGAEICFKFGAYRQHINAKFDVEYLLLVKHSTYNVHVVAVWRNRYEEAELNPLMASMLTAFTKTKETIKHELKQQRPDSEFPLSVRQLVQDAFDSLEGRIGYDERGLQI